MIDHALILAGGLGTRLGSITRDVPKPMVDVNGRPFLEHLILHLKSKGIQKFTLCTGYLSHVIENHFKDGAAFGVRVNYSIEKELLGTGGAIKKAAPLLSDEFVVISGDNYLELDYSALMRTFKETSAVGILSIWTNEPPLFRSNVHFDIPSKRILAYDFDKPEGKNFVDVGVKIFNRNLFHSFPQSEKFSLEIDVLPKIANAKGLFGFPVKYPPLDVGTLDGLKSVRETLQANEKQIR